MARGKVITTHLRTGDPNGIRTVFISNKICEMIVFPKSEFEMVNKMEESSRPALYILLGEDENGSAQAYIGESTNGVKRIYNHKSHKLFWNKCLMFVAKDESINKADVQYLERKAIDLATDCSQYGVMNEQSGKEISLSNYRSSSCGSQSHCHPMKSERRLSRGKVFTLTGLISVRMP